MVGILGRIYRLGTEVLLKFGFTTKISDEDLVPEAENRISEIIEDAYKTVNDFIKKFNEWTLEALPGGRVE